MDKKDEDFPLLNLSDGLQQQICRDYVESRLRSPVSQKLCLHYTRESIIRWLALLAQQIRKRNQTIFYLEQMQVDWLPEEQLNRLLLCLLFGLAYGLFYGIIICLSGTLEVNFLTGVITGLEMTLLIAGLFVLLNGYVLFNDSNRSAEESVIHHIVQQQLVSLLRRRSICGLVVGIVTGFFFLLIPSFRADLLTSFVNGIIFGAAYALTGRLDIHIQPIDIINWSWKDFQESFIKRFPVAFLSVSLYILGVSLFYPLFQLASSQDHYAFALFSPWIHPFSTQNNFMLSLLLICIITVAVAVGSSLPHGISRTVLSDDKRSKPNQGVWNSVQNSILLGIYLMLLILAILNLIIFIPHFVIGSPLIQWKYIESANVGFGLAVFGIGGLFGGGFAYIKHMILRFLLYRAGLTPWNYRQFLDMASESLLLRRDVGGYRFYHDLLLDYFLSCDSENSNS